MKILFLFLLLSFTLQSAEEDKDHFLNYFRQFGYCAMCTLEDSDVKSGGEPTVKFKVKELFWGDPKKYDIEWPFRVSAMTPSYRKSTFILLIRHSNKDPNNKDLRSEFFIYPIQSDAFSINKLKSPSGKGIKWNDLLPLLREEGSRLKISGAGPSGGG